MMIFKRYLNLEGRNAWKLSKAASCIFNLPVDSLNLNSDRDMFLVYILFSKKITMFPSSFYQKG